MALGGWQYVGMLDICCRLLGWREAGIGDAGLARAVKKGGHSDHQGSKAVFTLV